MKISRHINKIHRIVTTIAIIRYGYNEFVDCWFFVGSKLLFTFDMSEGNEKQRNKPSANECETEMIFQQMNIDIDSTEAFFNKLCVSPAYALPNRIDFMFALPSSLGELAFNKFYHFGMYWALIHRWMTNSALII